MFGQSRKLWGNRKLLLRRVIDHVKTQNWTAVALDFVIVVVGVFVGLQVQGWAEEQDRLKIERSYTVRLHSEVVDLQETRALISGVRHQLGEDLKSATALIFGDDNRPLSAGECNSIAFSYIVSNPTDDLASLIELQSSGGLSLFQNEAVLSKLRSFLLIRARAQDSQAGIANAVTKLPSRYPQLLKVLSPTVFSQTPPVYSEYQCDVEGMRKSLAFVNDFEINQANYTYHIRDVGLVDAGLLDLHQVLDHVLGITHEGAD